MHRQGLGKFMWSSFSILQMNVKIKFREGKCVNGI